MKLKKITFLSDYWNGITAGTEYTAREFIDVFGERAFNLILISLDDLTAEERERGELEIKDRFHVRVEFTLKGGPKIW